MVRVAFRARLVSLGLISTGRGWGVSRCVPTPRVRSRAWWREVRRCFAAVWAGEGFLPMAGW